MAGVGLVIGIGWAHETLYTCGITEVALGWLCADLQVETQWSVAETTSTIFCSGEPSDLRRALDTVTERLVRGPVEVERHRPSPGSAPDAVLLRYKFGYRAYGLAGATRYGFQTGDAQAVRDWLANVGQETCVSFFGDMEPADLPLPSVRPLPEPSRQQRIRAGLVTIGGLGVTWLHDRNPVADLAEQLIIDTVGDVLPAPAPGRASVDGWLHSIGADTRFVGLIAADPNVDPALTAPLVERLDRLRTDGPDELSIVAAMDRRAKRDETTSFDDAVGNSVREIWRRSGYTQPADRELSAEPEVLAEEVRRQCASLNVFCPQPPEGTFLPVAGATLDVPAASGKTYKVARALKETGVDLKQTIVIGPDRITHIGSRSTTVSAGTLALIERWPDGERGLYDEEGSGLYVDPLLWSKGDEIVAWIDQHAPRVFDREDRSPADPYVAKAAAKNRPPMLIVFAAIFGLLAVVMLVGAITGPDRVFKVVGTLFFAWAVGLFLVPLRYARRIRRRIN